MGSEKSNQGARRGSRTRWIGLLSLLVLLMTASSAGALSWSGPTARDTAGTGPAFGVVSCPTTSDCVAIDRHGGMVHFDPGNPAPSAPVGTDASLVTALDCLRPDQCLAVDAGGDLLQFNPSSATIQTTLVDPSQVLTGVACTPSGAVCVTVDGAGNEVSFTPGTAKAGAPKSIDGTVPLFAVSCASETACVAIDGAQKQITFNPSTGAVTSTGTVDVGATNASLTTITCRSATQCLAFDDQGREIVIDPTNSGSITTLLVDTSGSSILAAGCPSNTSCQAIDAAGNSVTFTPGQGRGTLNPVGTKGSLSDLACTAGGACEVVDGQGRGFQLSASGGQGVPPAVLNSVPAYTAVGCAGTSLCAAIDSAGNEVSFNPQDGSRLSAGAVDPGTVAAYGIACPSTQQCTAIDQAGNAITFNPGAPGGATVTAIFKGNALLGIACPSVTQCTVVDDAGHAATFNPQAPNSATYADMNTAPGISISAVACPSVTQCTAVSGSGSAETFNPRAPGHPQPTPLLKHAAIAVTCPQLRECVAVDAAGSRATFDPLYIPGAQSDTVSAQQPVALACPGAHQCLALDVAGNEVDFDPVGAGVTLVRSIGDPATASGLACAAPTLCAVVDSAGAAYLGVGALPGLPAVRVRPTVSGEPQIGSVLLAHLGRWTNHPSSYSIQWERCRPGGRACGLIPGATAVSLTLVSADLGRVLRALVTATNAGGSSRPVASEATPAIVGLPEPPVLAAAILRGVRGERPSLAFTLTAAPYGPGLDVITLILPAGVHARRGRLVVSGTGSHGRIAASARPTRQGIVVTLATPAPRVRLVLSAPDLELAPALRQAILRHRARQLQLSVSLGAFHSSARLRTQP